MKTNKLKHFVTMADALSDKVKDRRVDMDSLKKPVCGTPGCHAGLISIVAERLPELLELYKKPKYSNKDYYYNLWAKAFAVFLGFKCEKQLCDWALNNPDVWGNEYGDDMFTLSQAFIGREDKALNHRDIIEHWKQVLKNIENEGVKV